MGITPLNKEQQTVFDSMLRWATGIGNREWHNANDAQPLPDTTDPMLDSANWSETLSVFIEFATRTGGQKLADEFTLAADDARKYAGIDHQRGEQNCEHCAFVPTEGLDKALDIMSRYARGTGDPAS